MSNYKTFYKGFLSGYNKLPISSAFGKRWHPIYKKIKPHNGIDIAVPEGTELKAPLSGVIITHKTEKNGAGLYVTIMHHLGGSEYLYLRMMHLHSVDSHIYVGYQISEGERIGTTGGNPVTDPINAGCSNGAHLHLEVRFGGDKSSNAVNPIPWLAKETLYYYKTGKVIQEGNISLLSFSSNQVTSQTSYKYNSHDDITVNDLTEFENNKKKKETIAKERLAPGIWQITKLLIDSSVENKQVLDSGITAQQGSLLNFFRKVCQEPLVEFMGDTYGNQYYWIVRKPPFDKESVMRMMELTLINLDDNDIISTDLTWNNQEIYSWYQYIPYAELLGIKEANLFTPAIFFPEYASVWGSRPLCVESNYFNFNFSGRFNSDKKENQQNGDRIIRNAVRDFKYLIESNAYNPFTRRGVISLIGDRRIKRGTLIRHTSGEIFYVDSVTNTFDVSIQGTNRLTNLTVSRGMFPNFIQGKEIGGKNFSYFNLIDFGKDFDIEKLNQNNWLDEISKWKVDKEVFNFFMSKQQVYWENINKYKNVVDEQGNVVLEEVVVTAKRPNK